LLSRTFGRVPVGYLRIRTAMGELYMAPILAIAIAVCWLIAKMGMTLEKHINVPLWLHYYTWMYIMFAYLIVTALKTMFMHILGPTSWLDSEATDAWVQERMKSDGENVTAGFAAWKQEASLEGYEFVRWFSIISPIWVIATFAVCIWHTYLHVKQIAALKQRGLRGLVDAQLHHSTILILMLPLFYGLMSFKSVMRMWQVVIDHVGDTSVHLFDNWEERKGFLEEMYEANFMVGDIYETYALVTFGQLIMKVLRSQFRVNSKETNDDAALMEEMGDSIEAVTVSGVKLFAGTCLIQGVYTLVITTFAYMQIGDKYFSTSLKNPGLLQTKAMKAYTATLFQGMGLVSSWAAISNIMTVEWTFERFLGEFKSGLKFWGTKILVTLAFMQSIVLKILPPFSTWDPTRISLFYSSLLCFECFLIALLHCLAWSPDEPWYSHLNSKRETLLG